MKLNNTFLAQNEYSIDFCVNTYCDKVNVHKKLIKDKFDNLSSIFADIMELKCKLDNHLVILQQLTDNNNLEVICTQELFEVEFFMSEVMTIMNKVCETYHSDLGCVCSFDFIEDLEKQWETAVNKSMRSIKHLKGLVNV